MAVRVGSARHDENGKLRGGKAGDQTGVEVSKQNWYKHKKGWILIRAKSDEAREKIAQDMEYACENPHIGYDQGQNMTLFNAAKKVGFDCSKVKVNCETDCSRLVRVCCWYAGIEVPVFYTGNEVETLRKTGKFEILTSEKYTDSSAYLRRGDILCTKVTGHTVVVLSDGSKASERPKTSTLKLKSKGAEVETLQAALNKLGYTDDNGKPLKVDGKFGEITRGVLMKFQRVQGLKDDGICGAKTWAALSNPKSEYRVKTGRLNCRYGAGTQYRIKQVLKAGSVYRATDRSGEWIYLSEPKGWVNAAYVVPV